MITIYDPAVKNVRINRECERLLGWTQAELDQVDIMEAVYPDREYRERVRQYMHSLNPGWRDLEMATKDGRKLQTTWANIRLSDNRQVGIGLDITQRKQVEEDLRRLTGKLEQEVAERTRHLEHQTTRLRRLANELTHTEQRERRRLARLMHDHLQQLLVAGKMRLNGTRPDQLPVDLAEPIRGAMKLLDEAIDAGRSLTTELRPPVLYEDGLGAAVRWLAGQMSERHQLTTEVRVGRDAEPGDDAIKALLFETARELLFNAVKHGGADSVDIKLESLGDRGTRLTIRDNGRGFDPAMLDEDADHHSGFGLFSIRERLKALGGAMVIDSGDGRGAEVAVEAPASYHRSTRDSGNGDGRDDRRTATPATSSEADAEPDAAPIRVLLADDHQIVREGIAILLDDDERIAVVGEAEDGRDAIEQAKRLQPDVVLMDVNMPEMNGIEATRRLTDTMPDVGVVGLSVQGDGATARSCLDAGAFDYLSKNGDPQRLIDAIIRCSREHGMNG
jgi:PAS domain S-box-containing protein